MSDCFPRRPLHIIRFDFPAYNTPYMEANDVNDLLEVERKTAWHGGFAAGFTVAALTISFLFALLLWFIN